MPFLARPCGQPAGAFKRSGALRRAGIAAALAAALSLLGAASAFATPIVQPLPDSPFGAGTTNPSTVAFDPSGTLVAAANGDGSVSVLSVAPGGDLTPVAGSPFHTGSAAASATFSPDGSLLAVADPNTDAVDVLSVSAGGALTPIAGSPFSTGSGSAPTFVAFSPDGQLLAAANHSGGSVSVFSVAAGGGLAPVDGSPYSTGDGSQPFALAFSPNGTQLATADSGTDNISMFSVSAGGPLTEVAGSPFTTGTASQPLSVAFSADGGLLASANSNGNSLSIFTVSGSGALSPAPGSPHAIGNGARTVMFGAEGLLAVANYFSSSMSVFSASADGELTEVSGSRFATGYLTTSIAFSPNGGLLAAVSLFSSDITLFSVGAPSAQIDSPAAGGFYQQNQAVATSFSCEDAAGEPGIGSCIDSTGASGSTDTGSGSTGSGVLDTSTPGRHSYAVTATSSDTRTTVSRIAYTVAGPAAGANWSAGAPIPQARYAAAAAPLGNGDVLVTGGNDNNGPMSDSEIYHPSSDSWTQAADIPTARFGAVAATLPNGDVLVTGGLDGANNPIWDSEIYDPGNDSWTQAADLPTARYGAVAATLPDGDVLVTGGSDTNSSLSVSEIYHPSSDSWTRAADLPTARDSASGASLGNGDVLIAGGNNGYGPISDSEIYHPSSDSWTQAADLPDGRDRAAAVPLANGDVLLTGGYTNSNGRTSDTEIYDPGADSWRQATDVPNARYQAVAAPLPRGGALVVGGYDDNTGSRIEDTEISAARPSSTGSPSISGTTVAGQTLSVSDGSWSGWGSLTYSYQWYRCEGAGSTNCAPIDGTTAATYTLTSADVGHQVDAAVTATAQDGHSQQAVATPVGPVGLAQTITFTSTPPAHPEVGGSYTVAATGGGSGNPVVFSIDFSSAIGACSVTGSTVSFTGTGSCVIDADQAASSGYDPAPTAQQTLTVNNSQSITFTSTPPANPEVGGSYTVAATGGASGNPVTFSIDNVSGYGTCSVSGSTVSLTGPGFCFISANQAAGAGYDPAPTAQQFMYVDYAQAISFTSVPPAHPEVGGIYAVAATGGESGSPVLFSLDSASDSGACSVSGSTVSFTGPGSCVIDADQAAGPNYDPAPTAQQTLVVSTTQAIVFTSTPPTHPVVGASYTVAAIGGGSGNPVTFLIDNSSGGGVCSASGSTVSFTGAGSCVIDADQAAGRGYDPAPTTQQVLVVNKAQSISFTSTVPASPEVGGSYAVTATGGGSGNPVVFSIDSSSGGGVCSVSGSTVSFNTAGSCVIDADQAAGTGFDAAATAQQTLAVNNGQRITFTSTQPTNPEVGGTYTVAASGGGSGNPVTFVIDNSYGSGVCSISGSTVSFTGTGFCVISAAQAAGPGYDAAPTAQQVMYIDNAQTITYTSTPPANAGIGGTYAVSASGGGSGNPVTFSIDNSSGSGVCSVSGSTVSFTAAGTCVIDADQAAGGSYDAAQTAQQTLTVNQAQTITYTSTPPANPEVGGTYAVAATGGRSGHPVTFSIDNSSGSGVCSVSGSTVSFTATGRCVIDADQVAGAGYGPATTAQQTVQVVPGVSNVTPRSGPTTGASAITITGTGFVSGASVEIGQGSGPGPTAIPATNVDVISSTEIEATTGGGAKHGTFNLFVVQSGATSPATQNDLYAYGAPTITKISPNAGPTTGGGTVTITGTGMVPGATVAFGAGNPATNVTYKNASTLTATTPANTGQVDVTVSTTAGTTPKTQHDLYAYGAPTVTMISPNAGPTTGGGTVTITGTGMVPGARVAFGVGNYASGVTYQSPTTLTATAPAHASALVNVYVITSAGTSPATQNDLYAYGAPTITKISPNAGPTTGGGTVTITGTGMVPGATVAFGAGNPATNVTYKNASTLTATTPANTGQVDVTVSTTAGTTPKTQHDLYAYGAPTVTMISPNAGPTTGGGTVTITGTGMVPGARVAFGVGNYASGVTYQSPTTLTATAPAHASALVNVYVITSAGTSPATQNDLYAYGADSTPDGQRSPLRYRAANRELKR